MKVALLCLTLFLSASVSYFVEAADVSEESCQRMWLDSNTAAVYDFQKYSRKTKDGNLGYSKYAAKRKREKCIKEWTVLVYMAADNDLSPYAYWDLHEIESKVSNELNLGASTATVDVIVELDTLRKDGSRRLHMFQKDESYQENLTASDFDKKSPHFIKSPIVEIITEDKSTLASKRFTDFLLWGIKKYPSKNYMVVVWGHGEGFIANKLTEKTVVTLKKNSTDRASLYFDTDGLELPAFTDLPDAFTFPLDKPFGGVAFDHSNKSYLSIPEISNALNVVSESLLDGEKVDILAFDACLMQSLEVLAELEQEADFLVGSNQIQNYLGMPYRSLLDQINLGMTPRELALRLPELTKQSWSKQGYQGQADAKGFETFTMSSLSSWHLKEVVIPELQEVSKTLLAYLNESDNRREELLFLIKNAPRFQGEMIDLGLFYGLVEQLLWREKFAGGQTVLAEKLKNLLIRATQGVGESTLSATFGPLYYDSSLRPENSYLLGYFRGLSIWLPKSKQLFSLRIKEMEQSKLHKNVTDWNHLLESLYSEDLFDLGSF